MTDHIELLEKSISERLAELWGQLSRNQRRFVVAMQECTTKREAAESVGLEADTVYRWPKSVDECIELFSADVQAAALGIILHNAAKAAQVKSEGLESEDERIKQAAATEILDRSLGKPTQRQVLSGPDEGPIEINATDELISRLNSITARAAETEHIERDYNQTS